MALLFRSFLPLESVVYGFPAPAPLRRAGPWFLTGVLQVGDRLQLVGDIDVSAAGGAPAPMDRGLE